jgi:N-formylglutamate amidohydrolase
MAIQYIQGNFIKYHRGKGYISGHIEALHATAPANDQYTAKIVEKIIEQIGCAGIICTVSRLDCDLNRKPDGRNNAGVKEYRETIHDILQYLHVLDPQRKQLIAPYLHLSFHGMKDSNHGPNAIEIGTQNGQSCSPEVLQWFKQALLEKFQPFSPAVNIVFDKKFKGNESITFHRLGDNHGYLGYGQHFHSFQIEISHTLRRKNLGRIACLFAEIMVEFQKEFVAF